MARPNPASARCAAAVPQALERTEHAETAGNPGIAPAHLVPMLTDGGEPDDLAGVRRLEQPLELGHNALVRLGGGLGCQAPCRPTIFSAISCPAKDSIVTVASAVRAGFPRRTFPPLSDAASNFRHAPVYPRNTWNFGSACLREQLLFLEHFVQ